MKHITVLKNEAVLALQVKSDSIVVDATFGAGGHAGLILEKLSEQGTFIGLDADASALVLPKSKKSKLPKIHLINANFASIGQVLDQLAIKQVDGILADLGWRTDQFEAGDKGFSFQGSEPLLMTYGDPTTYLFTANDIVNQWEEQNIADVIFGYGEERYARRIAKNLVEARQRKAIATTSDLVPIIERSVPANYRHGRLHFATKTFQAFRIAVNDELSVLAKFITDASECLKPGGILTIISFHSLEDRIVKHHFREMAHSGKFELINKKPITPSAEELRENPRARSAKLRIITKNDLN